MAKQTRTATAAGTRLLDLWSPGPEFGSAIGCVATTFTFDPGHFEEQCLARFLGIETDPAESGRAYLIEREEKLSEAFACVLADQRHAAAQRSLRWHLLPVRCDNAIQHSKLSFLLWERHLRIIVSSANLTEPGYRRNREVAAAFDFDVDGGVPTELALASLDFLTALQRLVPGGTTPRGPRGRLATFLRSARQRVSGWTPGSQDPSGVTVDLVPLIPGPGSRSVPSQVLEMWTGSTPDVVTVVSPFYDVATGGLDRVYTALTSLLTTRGSRTLHFIAAGRRREDEIIEIEIPKRVVDAPARNAATVHDVSYVGASDSFVADAESRLLHAKMIQLERDGAALMMLGSSNCTVNGLGLAPAHNVELNVAYRIPARAARFYRACQEAIPPHTPVEDSDEVAYLVTGDQSEDSIPAGALLPAGFVEALYAPDVGGGSLELTLDPPTLPVEFTLCDLSGESILTAADWRATHQGAATVTLACRGPLSELCAKWIDKQSHAQQAMWPVNVSDPTLLPPIAELQNLSLEELLLVLTSPRPTHQVLSDITHRRGRTGQSDVALDPHQRVDTSAFILRRMRRLAKALEGLKERLERPLASREALHWRLFGPLGPLALAQALQTESGIGRPFFVAEIASMLTKLAWRPAEGLSRAIVKEEAQRLLDKLEALATADSNATPSNLSAYVKNAFQEARR